MRRDALCTTAVAIFVMLIFLAPPVAWAGDLTDAVIAKDLGRVETLLAAGANPDEKSAYGRPLYIAAADGSLEIGIALIRANADLEAAGLAGLHPLHMAAQKGRFAFAKLLVDHGANIEALDGVGRSPLMVSSYYGRDIEVTKFLLAAGADTRIMDRKYHMTALHFAAARGWLDVIEVLIGSGLDVNLPDGGGNTPLLHAAAEARFETAGYLIAQGANASTKNNCAETALQFARGNSQMEKLLRDAGAEPLHPTSFAGPSRPGCTCRFYGPS